jgi:2-methylcitrate dehydratase PrpD
MPSHRKIMWIEIHEALRPAPDQAVAEIADYVLNFKASNQLARETARYCPLDALGCVILALSYPACVKPLDPIAPTLKYAVAHAYPARHMRSISVPSPAGWISMAHGW